jgi:hypothetical protein
MTGIRKRRLRAPAIMLAGGAMVAAADGVGQGWGAAGLGPGPFRRLG